MANHNDERGQTPRTLTAMFSNAHDATDTPTDGDAVAHVKRAMENMQLKACAMCGAVNSRDGKACKKCACKLVYYCSTECQRKDWAEQKARCKKARATAQDVVVQEAIPGLPDHVVIAHIFRSLPKLSQHPPPLTAHSGIDPVILAWLRAVSAAMRDAVDATGIKLGE